MMEPPKNNWMRTSVFTWKDERNIDCYAFWAYAFNSISLYEKTVATHNSTVENDLTPKEALEILTQLEKENIKDPSKYKLPETKATEAPYKYMLPHRYFDTPHFKNSNVFIDKIIAPTQKTIPRKRLRFKKPPCP